MTFKNQERDNQNGNIFVGQTIEIDIYDRSFVVDDSTTQIIYPLQAADDPLHISSVDNSEDKLTPIRAIQARIKFLSDANFSLATFTDQAIVSTDPGDPRWYVEIKCQSKYIFKGFLVLDDCTETFMPAPNVVTLQATDGLGWLKNIPLTDFKTFHRGFLTTDGDWSSDNSVSNLTTSIDLYKTDKRGQTIQWVLSLAIGDQLSVISMVDPSISIIYQITSVSDFGTFMVFGVSFISGTIGASYGINTQWRIKKVGNDTEIETPMTYNRIADYLAWCLQKTGLFLNLRVVFNIRDVYSRQFSTSTQFNSGVNQFSIPVGYGSKFYVGEKVTISGTASNNGTFTITAIADLGFLGSLISTAESQTNETVTATFKDSKYHFFDKMYLDSRTFEDEIGTCINCYDVIQKILGEMAFLTQRSGEWWIYAIDETELNVQYNIATFYPDGSFNTFISNSSAYGQFIQKDLQLIVFSQESTEFTQNSQSKFVKETYQFEYWKENPCNSDFSRGNLIGSLPNENDENGNPCTVNNYLLDCWTMKRGFPGHTPIANDATDYIKRLFNANSDEVQRYVVVTFPTSNDVNQPYIESEPIPISVKDKISISVDYKFPTSITDGSGYAKFMYIVLLGDDGSYWIYGRDEPGNSASPQWYNTSGFTVNTALGEQGYNWVTTESGTDWATQSFDCAPAPVSGQVFIWLHGMNFNSDSYDDINIYYSNLQVTYTPFINGTYAKFTGIYDKVSRSIDFRANRDKQVYISDGIKKLFKGALFMNQNGSYVLVNQFFNWKAAPIPADNQIHPYLHLQTFDVWNQYRNVMKIFRATCQGLCSHIIGNDGELYYPSLIHTYYLQDGHPATINRRFMLLTFDQDWYKCEWTGTFAEVYRTDVPKSYDDTEEIKYLE